MCSWKKDLMDTWKSLRDPQVILDHSLRMTNTDVSAKNTLFP